MIHITSTYVADVLSSSLNTILQTFCNQQICFHYNQIFQQALLPNSEFNQNKNGLNVILLRSRDLFSPKKKTKDLFNELIAAINQLQKTTQVPLLIIFTPTQTSTSAEKEYYAHLENNLKLAIEPNTNALFVSSEEMQILHGTSFIFDNLTEKYGHIPYVIDFYNSLATIIARKYSLITRKPYKVIVLDCDGTLWNGIVEEDGVEKLIIEGEYLKLQYFMLDLFHAGFLLCLCSKNSEKSVVNVFKKRKEMVLDINKHICSRRINWLPKSTNIQSLAEELDLDLSSFIFIDDNHLECAEVKAAFPQILTIHLPPITPQAPSSRSNYLKNIWAFDVRNKSSEDKKRTQLYKQNQLRHALKSKKTDYNQFLKALKIKTTIRVATLNDLARILQLNQRTNQFNLFPLAISDTEFNRIVTQRTPTCLVIEVSDKYGDYGLVGVVHYEISKEALLVKAFLLSCRILGREIEYVVINHLAKIAEKQHKKVIKLFFNMTDKNIPGIEFLQHLTNEVDLQKIEYVELSISKIKTIRPKTTYNPKKNKKVMSLKIVASNDYMLDIAKNNVQHQSNSVTYLNCPNPHKLAAVEISLAELMKKYHLLTHKKEDVPFVELGINSLTSVLIASAIYQQFHIEIVPFELLKSDFTFRKLSHYLINQIKGKQVPYASYLLSPDYYLNEQPTEIAIETIHDMPLSLMQKQLWEDEQLFPGTSRNNMFLAYKVEGGIDVGILESTFVQLMARHDSLRFSFLQNDTPTSPFSTENEEHLLKINPLQSIDFKIHTFSSNHDKAIENYVTQFRQQPFNLCQAPLFRVAIIKKKEQAFLLFCIHHIIHDGWSLNILIGELSIIYNSSLSLLAAERKKLINQELKAVPVTQFSSIVRWQQKPGLRLQQSLPSPISYLNFIQWQRDHISEELLEKQREFWKKQLLHIPKLDLIYDKNRKEEYEKPLNQRILFKINAKTTQKLQQIALINQVTLYNVLASAFGIFLSHYADQNDINFITAVSGRHHPGVANMIGLFTSLVLMRMHISNEDAFPDLIKRNKKILDNILRNQDLPFNQIMQLTGEQVNCKMHSFNQAGFIFQSYPVNHLIINNQICKRVFADDKAELLYDACDECRFGSLVCFMQEHDSSLHGMFEYNTTLFDKKRIHYMIHSFKTLLKHLSENQHGPARSIPLVSGKQHHLLFNQWNKPKLNYPNNISLLKYFSEQVITRENAPAVIHNESYLTYGELDQLSNQFARKLRKQGIEHEIPVGIFLKKNTAYIVAMLSILKAGGCYVPLEVDLPIYRLRNIINDSGLLFVITDNEMKHSIIDKHYPEIEPILITDNSIQSESNAPLLDITTPRQLAYLMYTSGSTGNPKGIKIEQNGILRLVKSPNYIDINSSDRIAQTSSFLFDASTFEIWGALLNGSALVLIDKNILLNADSLHSTLKDKKISILFLTTQLFHVYTYLAPYLFNHLKYLIVGGEAVSYEAVKRIVNKKNRPRYFINGYGPTENTTFSTTYSIKSASDLCNPIPIGKPIVGTQVYVLDHALNPKSIGAPGRLYLGGIGLARGYINQKQLQKEKYIDHLGERLYDTGDMATWTPHGHLQYLGRNDNQIKMNGHRIELDEIEMQLKTHQLVMQAIVLVKNEHYHRQLVAYVLLKPGNKLRDLNLHHYLKTILPYYMLPKLYYQIDDIPLTIQGKVNKKTLLKKEFIAVNYTEYAPPTSILQEKLIAIYAEILNSPAAEISINAEFFDVGGNSISALQLIDKINQQFHIKINFSDIYDCASVKLLSEKIIYLAKNKSLSPKFSHDTTLKLIKSGSSKKTPIIFIHPIGGTGFCYLDLIKLLPENQPCYILQDPSIEANCILFEDMPSMAASYNQLLLKKFKSAKFILSGYSFGGMLSLEMVSQLEKQKLDDSIRVVIAFDTWVISNFLNIQAKEALRLSIMKKYKQIEMDLNKEHINPKPWMEIYYHRLQNLGFAYNPPIINKKIVLFKAKQQLNEFSAMNDSTNYLNAHTKQGVEVFLVSGNHDSILQYPCVREISQLLSQLLKDNVF